MKKTDLNAKMIVELIAHMDEYDFWLIGDDGMQMCLWDFYHDTNRLPKITPGQMMIVPHGEKPHLLKCTNE
jgi:hypothetical protein